MTDGVFNTQTVSIADGPTIEFFFSGATCRATLDGAQLYAELCEEDKADLRLTDANGEILADVVVNPRSHRTITENVMDVGSALLWSHWRYLRSQPPKNDHETIDPKSFAGELRCMSDMDDCREED